MQFFLELALNNISLELMKMQAGFAQTFEKISLILDHRLQRKLSN